MTGSGDLSGYLGAELLGQLGDAVTVVGPDWRYAYVSTSAAAILGRDAAECVGQSVRDLLPEVVGTPQHAVVVRAMEQRTRETFSWHLEGVGRWYEQHVLPVGDGLVIYLLDISDRMAEVDRAEQLAAAGEALAGAVSLEEVDAALLVHVHDLVEALAGSLLLADEERGLMHAVGWVGGVQGWTDFPVDLCTPSTTVHRTGEPVFVESLADARERSPAIVPELERLGGGPVAALPLVSAGLRLGGVVAGLPGGPGAVRGRPAVPRHRRGDGGAGPAAGPAARRGAAGDGAAPAVSAAAQPGQRAGAGHRRPLRRR